MFAKVVKKPSKKITLPVCYSLVIAQRLAHRYKDFLSEIYEGHRLLLESPFPCLRYHKTLKFLKFLIAQSALWEYNLMRYSYFIKSLGSRGDVTR